MKKKKEKSLLILILYNTENLNKGSPKNNNERKFVPTNTNMHENTKRSITLDARQ